MLRNIAIGLLAASVVAAPALAGSGSNPARTRAPAAIAAPAAPAKVVAPVRVVKHIKKHKRHRHVASVRGHSRVHAGHVKVGRAMTAAPAIVHVRKGART